MADFWAQELANLRNRIAELERMMDNTFRMGTVEEVNPKDGLMRLKIGKDSEGNDQLSPWRPYAQMAGALKLHSPVSKGQNMILISPAGDTSQGVAFPMSWNNANANPGENAEANVLTFGDVKISLEGGAVTFAVGGVTYKISSEGTEQTGGKKIHDGKNVGSDHTHGGVEHGSDSTDVPDN